MQDSINPRSRPLRSDVAGRTRRRLAAELLADIVRLDRLSRTE